jgi:hypothetical protein
VDLKRERDRARDHIEAAHLETGVENTGNRVREALCNGQLLEQAERDQEIPRAK